MTLSLPSETAPRLTRGRPLRLTQEVADTIVEAVEQGSYLKIAAQAAGVGQSTLAAWLARGRHAASARDAHDPEHLYCPQCDRDRTDEVASVDEHNAAAEEANAARAEGEEPTTFGGIAVLDRCPTPTCRTDEDPTEYTVPDDEAPFLELLEAVTLAQAKAETTAVAAWRRAFTGHEPDWRAARDYLARVAPDRWAGVTRVQMTTEEAERRIDDAVNETLLALGIDVHGEQLEDGDLDDLPDSDDREDA